MLVDTSVWIDYFNGHASKEADRLAHTIADMEPVTLPGIVVTEILLGLKSDVEADRIVGLLDAFDPAPELDHHDYVAAARLFRACRVKGITIRSTIDCLIAQLCIRHSFALLSKDKDFLAMAQCTSLRLVEMEPPP